MATQEERKAATRARLLDAAADLFARKGVHAVSVDAIAEAAGRTSGALYAHFGGKEGLLAALVDRWSREAAARISDEAFRDRADLDDRLLAVWQGWASGDDDLASWSQLEHELWLEATRRPEVAELVGDRFAAARTTTGTGLRAWRDRAAAYDGATADDGAAADDRAAADDGAATDPRRAAVDGEAQSIGALVLALLYGLEMQRRIDPDAVPDELALRGLRAVIDSRATPPPPTEGHHAHRAL